MNKNLRLILGCAFFALMFGHWALVNFSHPGSYDGWTANPQSGVVASVDKIGANWFQSLGTFVAVIYMAAGLIALFITYKSAGADSRRKLRVVAAGSRLGFLNLFLMPLGEFFNLNAMKKIPGLLMLISILALQSYSQARTVQGRVIGIADGDTVVVLDAARNQHRVRLSAIDAPEHRQPFGSASRKNLSKLIFKKEVTVQFVNYDRLGRFVGKLSLDGRDIGLEQIKAGMAWHYKHYEREQSREDRRLYADAESNARAARIGLWSEPAPTPPWDFRHQR